MREKRTEVVELLERIACALEKIEAILEEQHEESRMDWQEISDLI